MALEVLVHKIDQAVAGCLGTGEGAAEGEALTGENAGPLVAQALILTEHVADLATANAQVAGGNVGIGPMWRVSSVMKDWQNRMISLLDLPLGSKSEPPLPPPMGSVVRSS